MMWYNSGRRPGAYRGMQGFFFMIIFWIFITSHSFFGLVFGIITLVIVGTIIRAVMNMTRSTQQQRMQMPYQRQQTPVYQPPVYQPYNQGYQQPPEVYEPYRQPEARYEEQPRYQETDAPAQYEQPQAQYPEQLPPM